MPLSPTPSPHLKTPSPYLTAAQTIDQLEDDFLDLSLPSSKNNDRSDRRSPRQFSSTHKSKGKKKKFLREPIEGECFLLKLPVEVLHDLLGRLDPGSLKVLSVTCKTLRSDLEDQSIWRNSYVARFMDGIANVEDVRVLAEPCGEKEKGWRREALAREAMIERWLGSKATPSTHHPPVGLIHSLSLSYPAYTPSQPKLTVGKTHSTPSKTGTSTTLTATPSPEASKMTHRQKYEALLAATTRPSPHILTAGLSVGGIVRSDPLSGKVSKGYWGPSRDSNFHLRPNLDHISTPPTTVFLPRRQQNYSIWGMLSGDIVYTRMSMKNSNSQGGRASSINIQSSPDDSHVGEVKDIWADQEKNVNGDYFVSAGEDGKVKLWKYSQPIATPGKKTNGTDNGFLKCLFTSRIPVESFENRSDVVKLRQALRPDPVILVRCDGENVVSGVTADGDLRVWFYVGSDTKEVRLDVGSEEQCGKVKRMEMISSESGAEVLIHHERSTTFEKYAISKDGSTSHVVLDNGLAGITCLMTRLKPSSAISRPTSSPVLTPALPPPSEAESPAALEPVLDQNVLTFGQFVVVGDESGHCSIFSWNPAGSKSNIDPIRRWRVSNHKITAVESNCSSIAIGSADGYIKVYDPLSNPPTLLRSFHANHLSSADQSIATGATFDALYFTVNQIILENDLVVATIGRKVFCWRAGISKKKEGMKGKGTPSKSGPSSNRGIDIRNAHKDAEDDQLFLRSENTPNRHQVRQSSALHQLGLDDADEALQYAMMLSMEDQSTDSIDNEDDEEVQGDIDGDDDLSEGELEAIRAVRDMESRERREAQEVLEVVRRAEMRGA